MRGDLADCIAFWCETMQGGAPLAEALGRVVRALGAVSGQLVRASSGQTVCVARSDLASPSALRHPFPAFGEGQFGPDFRRSRSGTVWVASSDALPQGDADPALRDWQDGRNLSDFVAIVLSSGAGASDRIELHYAHVVEPGQQELLRLVALTLARTWAARRLGLAAMSSLSRRAVNAAPLPAPILAVSNPARLSRAEFRVCLLLSRGLSVQGVCAELNVAETTVRAHLRSIYAKTGCQTLAQLVYRLLANDGTDHASVLSA